jgi:hypothetical protein
MSAFEQGTYGDICLISKKYGLNASSDSFWGLITDKEYSPRPAFICSVIDEIHYTINEKPKCRILRKCYILPNYVTAVYRDCDKADMDPVVRSIFQILSGKLEIEPI